jgi:hypothetical protein
MTCITDDQAIIFIVLAFIVGFGVCFVANMKDEWCDRVTENDDYQDRAG